MIFGNWWINFKKRKRDREIQQALARHFDTHEEFMRDNNARPVKKHKDER